MTLKRPILILSLLLFATLLGCVNSSTIGSPILGSWETKIVGFIQSVRFESNGTGVLVTTLGQKAFAFQIVDADTIMIRYEGNSDWEDKTYNVVNNNTLQLDGLTWVRQGSV